MSNIQHKNHNLETFLKHLLTQQPLPQTATFTYSNTIQLVLQLIPNKGFVIGYNDNRVAKTDNPVMVWCDIYFKNGKTLTSDEMREAIMCARDLPAALDNSKRVIFEKSYFEMLQAMTQAIGQAKFAYAKNTKHLNGTINTQITKR